MTGLGERAHLFDHKINLDTHIQDILGVLRSEELSDIVLCGHSYGGMVVTGVADSVPEQVRSLVYLDALVPADGQNALNVLPADLASGLQESVKSSGSGGRVPPGPAEAFGVNEQDRAWVDRQNVDHPFNTFEQPIRLQDKWKQVPRHVYIHAAEWSPDIGKPFFESAQQEAGWQAIRLACGHYVMIDEPDDLTKILLASI